MRRQPSLSASPRAPWVRGLLFFYPLLGIFCFCGLTLAAGLGKYFQVERLSPEYFKITPRVQGPVSSQLVGGGGSQELITRQENGRTVI